MIAAITIAPAVNEYRITLENVFCLVTCILLDRLWDSFEYVAHGLPKDMTRAANLYIGLWSMHPAVMMIVVGAAAFSQYLCIC
jgi:hypothetical protein